MDAAALRAGADKGRQGERGAAALTARGQTAAGDGRLPHFAAVRLRHKLHQFFPCGEGSTSAGMMSAAACTMAHGLHSLSIPEYFAVGSMSIRGVC
jgi:hypothetical protein